MILTELAQLTDDEYQGLRSFLGVVIFFCFVGVLLWAIIRSATKNREPTSYSEPRLGRATGPPIPQDGPGKFVIVGVDRATKMDTTWRVAADSAANARVKAELEGIVVTSITRE